MKNLSGPLFLFGAFTLAGTSVIAARLVSGVVGTFTTTVTSLAFALVFLVPLSGRELRRTLPRLNHADWLMTGLQAVFGIFLFRLFLLQGLRETSTAEAGILTGATPAVTALLAAVLIKERVRVKNLSGIFCTVGGVLLVQGLFSLGSSQAASFSASHTMGNLWILGAASSEALFNVISRIMALKRKSGEPETISPLVQTCLVSALALLFCLVPAAFEDPLSTLHRIGLVEWLALAWYGIMATALAFIFFYAGIRRCQATTAAVFSGMMPFTSLVLSVVYLAEPAGWEQWMGGGLIVLGMLLIGI